MAKRTRKTARTFPIARPADNITVEGIYAAARADFDTLMELCDAEHELPAIVPTETLELTEDELNAVQIAAAVSEANNQVSPEPAGPEIPTAANDDFQALLDQVDDEQRGEILAAFTTSLDAREEFEREKSLVTGKDNIFKSIGKSRGKMSFPSCAAVLAVTDVDLDFANRVLNDGSRYNVYAIDKVQDLVRSLAFGDKLGNRINVAVVRSLIAFKSAGHAMTMDLARAAASDKIKVGNAALEKLLTRHTVSASTAPTQASSTMQALLTLGLVDNAGTQRAPIFTLNDSPGAKRLVELMA